MVTAMKPNILFIFSDQHRHDVMGCAGHPLVRTPTLDALAGRGLRFTRVWCQSPICQPSRASLITGRHPYDLDLFYNDKSSATHASRDGGDTSGEFDPEWPTVMKQLQAGGYETATIGKTHYHGVPSPEDIKVAGGGYDFRNYEDMVKRFGWDHVLEEFDKYVHSTRAFRTPYSDYLEELGLGKAYREQIRSVFRLTPTHWRGETSVVSQENDLTSFLADHAIDWLKKRRRDKPFLLKLAFVQPHVPLIDDPDWAAFYANADIAVPDLNRPIKTNEAWSWYIDQLMKHSQAATMTADFVREGSRHYFGMVSLIDQKIGEVLAALTMQHELENTWIIYSCDHGEMLGSHGLWAKMNFYHPSVQVPLLLVPPIGMTGRQSNRLSELTDVTATIADIAGVEPPAGCRGKSLLSELNCVTGTGHELVYSRIQSYAAVRDTRYRFTMEMNSGQACELFDLANDPDENENLVNEPGRKGMVDDYRDALKRMQDNRID